MEPVSLEYLQEIVRRIIDGGNITVTDTENITLTRETKLEDIPLLDSLNFTLIIVELVSELGVELSPYDMAQAPTVGVLLDMIQNAVDAREPEPLAVAGGEGGGSGRRIPRCAAGSSAAIDHQYRNLGRRSLGHIRR